MKKIIFAHLLIGLISGCSTFLPSCGSTEVKDSLLGSIKEKVTGEADGKLYIDSRFDTIITENKTSEKIQCLAQMSFSIPAAYQVEATKKISFNYSIVKNRAHSEAFSIITFVNFADIKKFNFDGYSANQNYLFKKAEIEYLSNFYNNDIAKKLDSNPLALFAMPALIDVVSYKKVNQKLSDAGWKFEGERKELSDAGWIFYSEPKDGIMTFIYTKNKFTLSLKTIVNIGPTMLGAQGLIIEDADIWEK